MFENASRLSVVSPARVYRSYLEAFPVGIYIICSKDFPSQARDVIWQ